MRTHLFVGGGTAFGEAVLGLRIADELAARGDRIVVLTPEGMSTLTEGRSFRSIVFTTAEHRQGIDKLIARVAAEHGAASIVLMDTTLVYHWLQDQGVDAGFAERTPVPLLGLDGWNVRETGLVWDVAGATRTQSKHSLDVTRRLIPVPLARPDATPGLYDALPRSAALSADEREDVRADLGVDASERIILMTSARWQHLGILPDAGRRLAASFPALVDLLLARLGKDVRVVHIGPEPYPMVTIGERYTWLAPRSPRRFGRLLASADLLLTFNFGATTIGSAIATGLPILLGINSHAGTVDEIVARLPRPPSGDVRAWLQSATPLATFRAWPVGLHRFLAPLATNNPYATSLVTQEVLQEDSFVDAARRLLFDEAARAALVGAQAAYRSRIAKLPKAADLVERYLKPDGPK